VEAIALAKHADGGAAKPVGRLGGSGKSKLSARSCFTRQETSMADHQIDPYSDYYKGKFQEIEWTGIQVGDVVLIKTHPGHPFLKVTKILPELDEDGFCVVFDENGYPVVFSPCVKIYRALTEWIFTKNPKPWWKIW